MRRLTVLTLFVSALTVSLWAGKPVPAPKDTPVTATLRCAAGYLNPDTNCPSSDSPDRIQGDLLLGPYVGNPDTGLGAFLASSNTVAPNSLRMTLSNSKGTLGPTITMDLRAPFGPAACAARKNCRRVAPFYFDVVTTDQSPSGDAVIPVDSTGANLPNGLFSIEPGVSADAKMKVNFPDPFGRDLTWTVRFDPGAYPGSSYVTVKRTGDNAWLVTATADSLGNLVVSPSGGAQQQTNEGLFYMPFQMIIEK